MTVVFPAPHACMRGSELMYAMLAPDPAVRLARAARRAPRRPPYSWCGTTAPTPACWTSPPGSSTRAPCWRRQTPPRVRGRLISSLCACHVHRLRPGARLPATCPRWQACAPVPSCQRCAPGVPSPAVVQSSEAHCGTLRPTPSLRRACLQCWRQPGKSCTKAGWKTGLAPAPARGPALLMLQEWR